jgi:hypothetical protein
MRFMWSDIKITSKMTILAYIGTYYAIAAAVPLTLANYLIVGWFSSDVDQFYLTSWKIFVGMAVVFNILVTHLPDPILEHTVLMQPSHPSHSPCSATASGKKSSSGVSSKP